MNNKQKQKVFRIFYFIINKIVAILVRQTMNKSEHFY